MVYFKTGHSQPLFLILVFSIEQLADKICWWLDSNRRSLVSEVTTLINKAQSLPMVSNCLLYNPVTSIIALITPFGHKLTHLSIGIWKSSTDISKGTIYKTFLKATDRYDQPSTEPTAGANFQSGSICCSCIMQVLVEIGRLATIRFVWWGATLHCFLLSSLLLLLMWL